MYHWNVFSLRFAFFPIRLFPNSISLTYYGPPLNLLREVYVSFIALKERLWAFLKYRQLMASMNRFADVTDEQLDEAGRTCIICRDEMYKEDCKQLPACQHLFHKSCLRSWLAQQQTCPT
jgi:E3 ubiquitin-protein ligase synoviolin